MIFPLARSVTPAWRFRSWASVATNFGRRLDLDGTRAVVDAALEEGVTFLDTADIYGTGTSEEFLGRVLDGRRPALDP